MLIGGVARMLVAKKAGGWTASTAAGGCGALFGGYLGRGETRADLEPAGFATALLGAFALVAVYHAVAATRRMHA
jgi:uncharacterized membrane protein YeaQ/YmgE (transglycosylase-associated protein family)